MTSDARALEVRVIELVARELERDAAGIAPETLFADDLGADSLDIVAVVTALEQAFDLRVSDEALDSCRRVTDLIELVRARPR